MADAQKKRVRASTSRKLTATRRHSHLRLGRLSLRLSIVGFSVFNMHRNKLKLSGPGRDPAIRGCLRDAPLFLAEFSFIGPQPRYDEMNAVYF